MADRLRLAVVLAAALTTGLMAGFFYAYSCSVMLGLERLDAAGFVRAMQAINASVRNPLFAAGFFGALLTTGAAAVGTTGAPRWRGAVAGLLWGAFALYAVGAFGVTMTQNVPLNEALAQVRVGDAGTGASAGATGASGTGPGAPGADLEAVRRAFVEPWNRWNAVRTAASTAALLCLCLALVRARAFDERGNVLP